MASTKHPTRFLHSVLDNARKHADRLSVSHHSLMSSLYRSLLGRRWTPVPSTTTRTTCFISLHQSIDRQAEARLAFSPSPFVVYGCLFTLLCSLLISSFIIRYRHLLCKDLLVASHLKCQQLIYVYFFVKLMIHMHK